MVQAVNTAISRYPLRATYSLEEYLDRLDSEEFEWMTPLYMQHVSSVRHAISEAYEESVALIAKQWELGHIDEDKEKDIRSMQKLATLPSSIRSVLTDKRMVALLKYVTLRLSKINVPGLSLQNSLMSNILATMKHFITTARSKLPFKIEASMIFLTFFPECASLLVGKKAKYERALLIDQSSMIPHVDSSDDIVEDDLSLVEHSGRFGQSPMLFIISGAFIIIIIRNIISIWFRPSLV
jgi:hypothetical protein